MSELLRKLESESENEYIARMYRNKIENNLSNIEIKDIINETLGTNYAESTLRGIGKYINEGIDIGINKALSEKGENKALQELEEKILELKTQRKKLNITKNEYNRNFNKEIKSELLYETLQDKIVELKPPMLRTISIHKSKKESIEVIADIHYGAKFVTTNNEYSREICKERFEQLLSETIGYVKDNDLNTLKIVNNGDSLQGMLRINDLKMNDIPVVESLVEFSQLMASFLNELSAYVNIEYYQVPSANHTELRLLNSKAGEMANEDMEKIIINYIGDMLRSNDRVYVHREMKLDNIQFELCGYNFMCMHGHQLKNINSAIRDLSQRERKFIDYLLLGHLHGGKEIVVGEGVDNQVEVLLTPSFVGTCPYANSLMVGSKSMVKIYEFEEHKGHVGTKNIILN